VAHHYLTSQPQQQDGCAVKTVTHSQHRDAVVIGCVTANK
jgi:hypothetical protein